MDILCSDKTGTITQNSISIGEIRTFPGVLEQEVIIAAALASQKESNDPIDMAIFSKKPYLPPLPESPVPRGTRLSILCRSIPTSKYAKAKVRNAGGTVIEVAKGAPQAIASLAGTEAVPRFNAGRLDNGIC